MARLVSCYLAPTLVLLFPGFLAQLSAQENSGGALSAELAVLQRRVGTWQNVNVIKPGPWMPDGGRVEAVETIRWMYDGQFIEGNALEPATGVTNTHLMTYDPASKTYRMWYFDSNGSFTLNTLAGRWDKASETLRLSAKQPDGVTASMELRLGDPELQVWIAKWTGPDGAVLMEIEGRQTRQADAPDAKNVVPSVADAADPAGPAELKRFAGFIGDWQAEVRDNRAETPQWARAGSSHKFWTLGGRFVRDEVRNVSGEFTLLGLWTYDPNEKTHREWYFFPDGNVLQSTAAWDEASQTMNLDGTWMRGGILRGPRQLTGTQTYIWEAFGQDAAGNVQVNMSGRQQRK